MTEQEIIDAWNALSDKALCCRLAGETEPNLEVIFNDIRTSLDSARMNNISSFSAQVAADLAMELEARENAKRRGHGNKVMDYIAAINISKNATTSDLSALMALFNDAFNLLSGGAIQTARGILASADISTVIWDEADRTAILAKIDEY